MTLARRIGWGMGLLLLLLLLLLLAAAFASTVRIRVAPPAEQAPLPAEAPLVIPVQGVRAAQLTDTWGQSRAAGRREHHAIDILAPRGTPVLAAASGTIEKLFESEDGGHTLYVRTSDGLTIHYYAHLDSYAVGEGEQVRQGQRIAAVGNTGNAAGGPPHLHFEIKAMRPGEGWWEGTNVNPYPLLAASPGGG